MARKLSASTFIGVDRARMNPGDLRERLAERDRRLAADTRTEAEIWLGDPPASRSALAQASQQAPRRSTSQRVDLWKR